MNITNETIYKNNLSRTFTQSTSLNKNFKQTNPKSLKTSYNRFMIDVKKKELNQYNPSTNSNILSTLNTNSISNHNQFKLHSLNNNNSYSINISLHNNQSFMNNSNYKKNMNIINMKINDNKELIHDRKIISQKQIQVNNLKNPFKSNFLKKSLNEISLSSNLDINSSMKYIKKSAIQLIIENIEKNKHRKNESNRTRNIDEYEDKFNKVKNKNYNFYNQNEIQQSNYISELSNLNLNKRVKNDEINQIKYNDYSIINNDILNSLLRKIKIIHINSGTLIKSTDEKVILCLQRELLQLINTINVEYTLRSFAFIHQSNDNDEYFNSKKEELKFKIIPICDKIIFLTKKIISIEHNNIKYDLIHNCVNEIYDNIISIKDKIIANSTLNENNQKNNKILIKNNNNTLSNKNFLLNIENPNDLYKNKQNSFQSIQKSSKNANSCKTNQELYITNKKSLKIPKKLFSISSSEFQNNSSSSEEEVPNDIDISHILNKDNLNKMDISKDVEFDYLSIPYFSNLVNKIINKFELNSNIVLKKEKFNKNNFLYIADEIVDEIKLLNNENEFINYSNNNEINDGYNKKNEYNHINNFYNNHDNNSQFKEEYHSQIENEKIIKKNTINSKHKRNRMVVNDVIVEENSVNISLTTKSIVNSNNNIKNIIVNDEKIINNIKIKRISKIIYNKIYEKYIQSEYNVSITDDSKDKKELINDMKNKLMETISEIMNNDNKIKKEEINEVVSYIDSSNIYLKNYTLNGRLSKSNSIQNKNKIKNQQSITQSTVKFIMNNENKHFRNSSLEQIPNLKIEEIEKEIKHKGSLNINSHINNNNHANIRKLNKIFKGETMKSGKFREDDTEGSDVGYQKENKNIKSSKSIIRRESKKQIRTISSKRTSLNYNELNKSPDVNIELRTKQGFQTSYKKTRYIKENKLSISSSNDILSNYGSIENESKKEKPNPVQMSKKKKVKIVKKENEQGTYDKDDKENNDEIENKSKTKYTDDLLMYSKRKTVLGNMGKPSIVDNSPINKYQALKKLVEKSKKEINNEIANNQNNSNNTEDENKSEIELTEAEREKKDREYLSKVNEMKKYIIQEEERKENQEKLKRMKEDIGKGNIDEYIKQLVKNLEIVTIQNETSYKSLEDKEKEIRINSFREEMNKVFMYMKRSKKKVVIKDNILNMK